VKHGNSTNGWTTILLLNTEEALWQRRADCHMKAEIESIKCKVQLPAFKNEATQPVQKTLNLVITMPLGMNQIEYQ
jgi:hypothetical protein